MSSCSVYKGAWTGLLREERNTEALHERAQAVRRDSDLVLRLHGSPLRSLLPPHPFTVDSIRNLRPTLLLLLKARALLPRLGL